MAEESRFSRTEMLLGAEGMARLSASAVAVFGIGGVGSYAAEGLARAGIGHLVLIDSDRISPSNINRQIHALSDTIGQKKTAAMGERIRRIHPGARVDAIDGFYLPGCAEEFFRMPYDYVVDAVDTLAAKIDLVLQCRRRGIPIISSMGTGNKLDPTQFEVMDLYRTSMDPVARIMRRELRKHGVDRLKVVCSKEPPLAVSAVGEARDLPKGRRSVPGSVSFVPSVAGLILAGEVVRDLAGIGS